MDHHAIAHYFSFKEQFAFVMNDIDVGRAVSLYYILPDTHVQNFLYYIINRFFAKTLCFYAQMLRNHAKRFVPKRNNLSKIFLNYFWSFLFISRYVLCRFTSFIVQSFRTVKTPYILHCFCAFIVSDCVRVIKGESYLFDICVDILM